MVKSLFALLALFIVPSIAGAQVDALQQRGGHLSLVSPLETPGSLKLVGSGSNPVEIYTNGVKVAETDLAGGFRITQPLSVPTMAATPVAGTNSFKLGINIVPTAAANTAAFLPTPSGAGQEVIVINSMANAVRIKPGGSNTINAATAGAYVTSAAASITNCKSISSTGWQCGSLAVPTPAGP